MNDKLLNQFLNCGFFIGDLNEDKIWLMSSSIRQEKYLENNSFPFFYLNNFFSNKKNPFYKGLNFQEMNISDFQNIIEKESSKKPDIKWDQANKDFYLKQYSELKKELSLKVLKKGVPYTFQEGSCKLNNENKLYLIKNILKNRKQNSSYIYGFWKDDEGFIGTTPELLFIQKNNNIQTIALAGTVPNEKNVDKNKFINDPKMRNEHVYVIEGMKQTLEKFGEFSIGKTHLLELPKLIHLKTDINIKISENIDFDYESFLKELHPTAALGILPKNSKSSWLKSFESTKINRGYFAAPFGVVLNKNNSIFISTIRGMQWQNKKLKISAGGGVIQESIFADEWIEILSKINSIKDNLGLHSTN
ncbi:chorismate-binding protein [Fluviispira vulneris]|uniref:chorismate-binding protein n=1 Tax=Fluviispira vulneris TaxID=2763012 RepID=UPI00164679B7|nr:chorismate-binding protein [Fluviispira vulneris]